LVKEKLELARDDLDLGFRCAGAAEHAESSCLSVASFETLAGLGVSKNKTTSGRDDKDYDA
jgi:hypothetical protein